MNNRIIFLTTLISTVTVGLHAQDAMVAEIEGYKDQITQAQKAIGDLKAALGPVIDNLKKKQIPDLKSYKRMKNDYKKTVDDIKSKVDDFRGKVRNLGVPMDAFDKAKKRVDEINRELDKRKADVEKKVKPQLDQIKKDEAALNVINSNIRTNDKKISDRQSWIKSAEKKIKDAPWYRKVDVGISEGAKITGWGVEIAAFKTANVTQVGYKATAEAVLKASREALKRISDPKIVLLETELGATLAYVTSAEGVIKGVGYVGLAGLDGLAKPVLDLFAHLDTMFASLDRLLQNPIDGLTEIVGDLEPQMPLMDSIVANLEDTKTEIDKVKSVLAPPPPPPTPPAAAPPW